MENLLSYIESNPTDFVNILIGLSVVIAIPVLFIVALVSYIHERRQKSDK